MEPIVTTYVEMKSYVQFCPAYINDLELTIMEAREPLVDFYRFLYSAVGRDYAWLDRNEWSDEKLLEHLSSSSVSLWVAYYRGTPAGYMEIMRESHEPGTEIVYFGLIPTFHGRGIGKHLLSYGVQRIWEEKPERVWLHTCTLDGPHALDNYKKRGFVPYKVETKPGI